MTFTSLIESFDWCFVLFFSDMEDYVQWSSPEKQNQLDVYV